MLKKKKIFLGNLIFANDQDVFGGIKFRGQNSAKFKFRKIFFDENFFLGRKYTTLELPFKNLEFMLYFQFPVEVSFSDFICNLHK